MTAALRAVPAPITDVDSGGIGPLPFAMTPLIGREAQVAQVAERLTSPAIRLLTLIGPGGVGKTRLALAAAHAVRSRFEDGALLLRLAPVTDPALAPIALARALDVRGPFDAPNAWAIARQRRCLLVVDNFEQLLAAAASIVDVLSHCPHVTMLVTSRIPLQVSGEHEYQVPHLATPPEDAGPDLAALGQADAVRLFVERARAVNPDFRLTSENAVAVARIARQLDGLPLAIELAAARCKHLSPMAIVDRLTGASDILRGGPVDRPPHQRSIRDTIAWSFNLLDASEQTLFRRLSVFAGGFLPQAAAYVCDTGNDPPEIQPPDAPPRGVGSFLDACIGLVDKNLLVTAGELAYEPRFSMLLTIRSFAHEEPRHRGEWETIGHRHAAWYLALAKAAAVEVRGPSQSVWLDWLEVEHANLRIALTWFREHGHMGAFAAMADALGTFWLVRGHLVEGLRWLQMVVAAKGMDAIEQSLHADLHCAAGWLALRQGLPDVARAHAEQSLVAARPGASAVQVAAALRLLGDIEDRESNYARATELMREALVAYREAGDQTGIADTLTGLAGISMDTGDYDEAERTFREAVTAATATGDAIILARALDSLSLTLHVKGESVEAIACAERALELYRTHGNVRGIAIAMDHVGKYSRALGDPVRAWSCHRESLAWRRKVGDPRGMAVWLEAMAGLLAACGAVETAAVVLGAVESIRRRGGFPIHDQEEAQLQPTLRRIDERLDPGHVARSWARGSQMSLPEIVDLAYAGAERAVAAWSQDEDQPQRRTVTDGPGERGLTARERDVARLLVQDLSDKEIASRLAISPRTVSTHVTAILGKLGLHSRRDITRILNETDLDGDGEEPLPGGPVE